MKKFLLIALALGLGITTFAQKGNLNGAINRVAHLGNYHQSVADPNQPATYNTPVKQKPIVVAQPKASVSSTRIGTSGNMLTVQMPNLRILSSYPDLNVISFTHRGGGSMGSDVNHQITSFSLDGGLTFQRLTLKSNQTWANRYPSGVLYNPVGNTVVGDMHLAYCGPFHLGGVWTGYYFASERLDGTDTMYNYHHWTITPAGIEPENISSSTDGYVHTFTVYSKDTATTTNSYTIPYYTDIYNGFETSAEDTIQWNSIRMSLPACVHSTGTPIGELLYSWGQAWSQDGTIGYIYYFGVDSLTPYNNSVVPIVYKSTTQGSTWVKLSTFDFSTLPIIADSIMALHTNSALKVPGIFGNEYGYSAHSGVVDANGNLHICTTVCGEFTNYTDSVGFTYLAEPIKLYDLYTTPTGWGANYITRINSLGVLYTDAQALPSTTTGAHSIGWNHRISTSRTKDGTMLFVTYLDEPDTVGYSKLVLPQLYSYGWNVNTGYNTGLVDFTSGTLLDGMITWMYASDRVLTTGTNFVIPVTYSVTGNYQEDTCAHYYLSGVTFPNIYVGINEANENSDLVSQNFPNPFSGTTNITVKLTTSSNLVLSVVNILGDKVFEVNEGNVSAGNHNYTIDCSKLSSGIYFYTVKAGDKSVTHKMIIE